MTLQGKGFFIWQIARTENGDPGAIATLAQQAQYTHVLVKIADGDHAYNVDSQTGADRVPPLVQALKANGIQVWGWHYVYGDEPVAEANIAIQRVQALGLDGYVIDAESEYEETGKDTAAQQYMSRLRAALPNFALALSSFRYPTYHPRLPWQQFLEKCDLNMPQVYWLQAHNPVDQLTRCVREFQALSPYRPIIPVGAAFKEGSWAASSAEVTQFLQTAQSLNLSAANFWEWANCRLNIPDVWNAIQNYSWSTTPPSVDIAQKYIQALNTHDLNQVMALYQSNAVHVTAASTLQGSNAIRSWYANLFNQALPAASFTLTGYSGSGVTRHLTWTASSRAGNVHDGRDTLGLSDGKIIYHYSFFHLI